MSSGGVQLPEAKSTGAAGRWGRIHLGIVAAGALLLALMANYDALWFDEAYSVGMAAHSFEEIWTIGAADVHPVLYYWMLHCVYLVFGQNIVVYRLVSVAGAVALAMLGYTHVRKDFGPTVGMLFSALVFLVPWSMHVALQIRMYAWLMVAVMVAAIYGWRLTAQLLRNGHCRLLHPADGVGGGCPPAARSQTQPCPLVAVRRCGCCFLCAVAPCGGLTGGNGFRRLLDSVQLSGRFCRAGPLSLQCARSDWLSFRYAVLV